MQNIYLAISIGVSSSILAAILTYIATYFYNKHWYNNKYGRLAGNYKAYGYKKNTSEWELKEKPQGEAIITYIRKNILEIEVGSYKNNRYKWKGTIYMDSENHGSISWRYIKWKGEKYGCMNHKFGFKRVILVEDEHKKYFYLSPELGDGFDKVIYM